MNLRSLILLLVIFTSSTLSSSAEPPQKWEYKVVLYRGRALDPDLRKAAQDREKAKSPEEREKLQAAYEAQLQTSFERVLNLLGAEGWELCFPPDKEEQMNFKRKKAN